VELTRGFIGGLTGDVLADKDFRGAGFGGIGEMIGNV
jgi:hypothetical protein